MICSSMLKHQCRPVCLCLTSDVTRRLLQALVLMNKPQKRNVRSNNASAAGMHSKHSSPRVDTIKSVAASRSKRKRVVKAVQDLDPAEEEIRAWRRNARIPQPPALNPDKSIKGKQLVCITHAPL